MSASAIHATEPQPVPEGPDPLDQPGGPSLELAAKAASSVGELLCQLRVKCGSLVRASGGAGAGYLTASPARWRCLRDVPACELIDACRRVERTHPGVVWPGSDAQPIHVRIGHLLRRLEAE